MKPAKKNCDGIMCYNLIYNHYLSPSNMDGEEKKLYHFTHTGGKIKRNLQEICYLA